MDTRKFNEQILAEAGMAQNPCYTTLEWLVQEHNRLEDGSIAAILNGDAYDLSERMKKVRQAIQLIRELTANGV